MRKTVNNMLVPCVLGVRDYVSEYVKHAVFQIWMRIWMRRDFYEENISALEATFGWQEA